MLLKNQTYKRDEFEFPPSAFPYLIAIVLFDLALSTALYRTTAVSTLHNHSKCCPKTKYTRMVRLALYHLYFPITQLLLHLILHQAQLYKKQWRLVFYITIQNAIKELNVLA